MVGLAETSLRRAGWRDLALPRANVAGGLVRRVEPSRSRTRIALLGLLLLATVALGVRVALVLVLRSDLLPDTTYEHGVIAENLLAGRGFRVWFLGTEGPTSQQAPVYPFLLAGVYWLFGGECSQALLAMQLLQCLAGTGLVLSLVWLAWQMLPQKRSIGWLAGAGAALYPTHIYMVSHIQVAVWATLGLVLTLALACWTAGHGGRMPAVLAGVVAGLTILTDPILTLVLPVAVWCLVRQRTAARQTDRRVGCAHHGSTPSWVPWPRLRGHASADHEACSREREHGTPVVVLVFLLTTAVVVTPWVLRNALVHGEFVFVKSTFGYAFWQGNNPTSWGTDKVPKASADRFLAEREGGMRGLERAMWEARHETLYIDDVVLKPTGYAEFQGLSEPQRARLLFHRAKSFVLANPADYLALCVQRLRYFLLFDETNPKTKNLVYRAATLLLFTLAIVGFLVGRRWWPALLPTLCVFASVALFHTLTITSARFRIPVEPMQMLWAAIAVSTIAGAVHRAIPLERLVRNR